MNERNYNEKVIVTIRECIALGVSSEFLYTLIEMDASEEEFEKLVLFRSTEKTSVENSEKKEEKKEVKTEGEEFYYGHMPEYIGGDVWNGIE